MSASDCPCQGCPWCQPDKMTADEVRVTSSTGGAKGKKLARYDLVPSAPLRQLAEVYGRGSMKYADHNWRKGYDWSLSFAALNRHLWQFWDGEDIDAETGAPHMAAVAFHAFALLQFMEEQRAFDDRPGTPGEDARPFHESNARRPE